MLCCANLELPGQDCVCVLFLVPLKMWRCDVCLSVPSPPRRKKYLAFPFLCSLLASSSLYCDGFALFRKKRKFVRASLFTSRSESNKLCTKLFAERMSGFEVWKMVQERRNLLRSIYICLFSQFAQAFCKLVLKRVSHTLWPRHRQIPQPLRVKTDMWIVIERKWRQIFYFNGIRDKIHYREKWTLAPTSRKAWVRWFFFFFRHVLACLEFEGARKVQKEVVISSDWWR